VGPLFFEQTITVENDPHLLTQFIALLEEINTNAGFGNTGGDHPDCKNNNSFLLSVAFGHPDPQTSSHLISFYEDFLRKESTAITQDAWSV